jgi:hypothetical protein
MRYHPCQQLPRFRLTDEIWPARSLQSEHAEDATPDRIRETSPRRRLSTFTVANSGSLSFSYDGDPRAAYVVIDGDEIVIRRVEYDVEAELRLLSAAHYPDADWLAQIYRAAKPVPPPKG